LARATPSANTSFLLPLTTRHNLSVEVGTPVGQAVSMTFRHVVLLTLRPETEADDGILEALRALPDQIPEVRDYVVGVDLGLGADNASVAVVADFDDRAGWEVYRDHPAHRRVVDQLIAPRLVARAAVQHDVAD
jgi:hypothetical protein